MRGQSALMSEIDQLERLLADKHAAMLKRDWPALERTVEQIEALAGVLGSQLDACPSEAKERLLNLRGAAERSARLAKGLSAQLTRLAQGSRPAGLYTRAARVRQVQPALLHCVG